MEDPGRRPTTSDGHVVAWLTALPFAAVVVGEDGVVVAMNARAAELLGRQEHATTDPLSVLDLFEDMDQGAAAEVQGTVLAGARWQGRLRMKRAGDTTGTADLAWSPLVEDVACSLLVIEDVPAPHRDANRLAEQLNRLAKAATELLLATNLEDVTNVATGHLADAMGATVASLSLVEEPGRLRLLAMRGGRPGAINRWRTYGTEGTPAGDSVTSGRPLVLTGREEIRGRYPDLESAAEGDRTLVCLPLLVAGRAIGVVTLTFPGRRTFNSTELEFFGVMADTCSQAIDRLRATAAAADRSAKLRYLADATAELSSSLDYESTLTNVAQAAVPWFADWCSIALGFDGVLRTLAVAHVDPAKVALAREYEERFPPDPQQSTGSYQVFRTGQSQLVPEITDEMLDAAVSGEEQREMVRQLNLRSALAVPLKVGERVLGVVTWVAGGQGRRFTPDDVTFGEDLARRAAVAIDNAQLHTELREMAVRLQRAVLPEALPELPGWEVAAHYSPSGRLDAGGDFYDIIPLDDDRFALFIGDVMGRGVHAAAAMAQMRAAMRVLVAVDPEPASVLTRLDTFFERYQLDQLVTMLYFLVESRTGRVVVANAGHLPPVVLRDGSGAETVTVHEDLLLGAPAGRRSVSELTVLPGESLLAFTDGLVERRGEDIDVGQRRLLAACDATVGAPVRERLLEVVRVMADPDREDDVAALVVHRSAGAPSASGVSRKLSAAMAHEGAGDG